MLITATMSYLRSSPAQHSTTVSNLISLYQARDFGKQDLCVPEMQQQHVAGSDDWVSYTGFADVFWEHV